MLMAAPGAFWLSGCVRGRTTVSIDVRFGGSRIKPARMAISPGVATPTAAMSAIVSPAVFTASSMVAHMVFSPASCPRSGLVSRVATLDATPVSSTTAAFMVVPPTSKPTNFAAGMGRGLDAENDDSSLYGGGSGCPAAGGRRIIPRSEREAE